MKVMFSVEETLQLLEQSDQQALRPRMFAQFLWPPPYLRVCSRCHLCPWSSPLLSRPRHWYLRPLQEAINQGVGVKEDWGTGERVREAEADHCRAPVHHLSSGGRGGLVARIFASRCPLEREAYNQVHEGPQLPAGSPPRNSSRWCRWCRDPFFQSLSTVCGTVRHWMICPSLVVSTTEDLTRDFREVVEYN